MKSQQINSVFNNLSYLDMYMLITLNEDNYQVSEVSDCDEYDEDIEKSVSKLIDNKLISILHTQYYGSYYIPTKTGSSILQNIPYCVGCLITTDTIKYFINDEKETTNICDRCIIQINKSLTHPNKYKCVEFDLMGYD